MHCTIAVAQLGVAEVARVVPEATQRMLPGLVQAAQQEVQRNLDANLADAPEREAAQD